MNSCRKGKAYERAIARVLRARFPGADVRRSSQADRAGNSDVRVEGHPVLATLWLELTDQRGADVGTALGKLAQAERDVAALPPGSPTRWPVIVWHRTGARTSWVTARL